MSILPFALRSGAAYGWLEDRWRVVAWGLGDSFAFLLFVVAAERGPAAVASVLVAQFATVAVVVGMLFGGERLLRRQLAGVLLVILAVTGIAAAGAADPADIRRCQGEASSENAPACASSLVRAKTTPTGRSAVVCTCPACTTKCERSVPCTTACAGSPSTQRPAASIGASAAISTSTVPAGLSSRYLSAMGAPSSRRHSPSSTRNAAA